MAETTDNYPSDSRNGDFISEKHPNRIKSDWIDDHWRDAADDVIPKMVSHIAGLYELFWMSTHFPIKINNSNRTFYLDDLKPELVEEMKKLYKDSFTNDSPFYFGSPSGDTLVKQYGSIEKDKVEYYYREYRARNFQQGRRLVMFCKGSIGKSETEEYSCVRTVFNDGIWNAWEGLSEEDKVSLGMPVLEEEYSLLAKSDTSEEIRAFDFEFGRVTWQWDSTKLEEVTHLQIFPGVCDKFLDLDKCYRPECTGQEWYCKYIRHLLIPDDNNVSVAHGKVGGQCNYARKSNITRSEFLQMALIAAYPDQEKEKGLFKEVLPSNWQSDFDDVPYFHWAAPYISFACEKNFVTCSNKKLFNPETVISRVEATKILVLIAEAVLDPEEENIAKKYINLVEVLKNGDKNDIESLRKKVKPFNDLLPFDEYIAAIDENNTKILEDWWYFKYVYSCQLEGIFHGFAKKRNDDGTISSCEECDEDTSVENPCFCASNNLTRGQAAKIISIGLKDFLNNTYSDCID